LADEYALLLDVLTTPGMKTGSFLLGLSAAFRVLVVVHTYRAPDDIIRIISARKVTKMERQQYANTTLRRPGGTPMRVVSSSRLQSDSTRRRWRISRSLRRSSTCRTRR